jgi:hypothetical protein
MEASWILAAILVASPLETHARLRLEVPSLIAVGDRPSRLSARGASGIRFESRNPRVARVTGNRIRAVSPGNARIVATALNGESASRRVTVGSRARFLGSSLAATPNLAIGPEQAPILDPVSGLPVLAPSGQTSCTLRNAGYIGSLRAGSIVPGSGVIRRIRVRCGANPAAMQAVVMSGSPGLYGTALRTSRVFRPRANTVTEIEVNLRVTRSLTGATNVIDAVGLNVFGPGTMPLADQGTAGTFAAGSALLQHWYPTMRAGVPENGRAYNIDGVELLLSWEYIQVGGGVLR